MKSLAISFIAAATILASGCGEPGSSHHLAPDASSYADAAVDAALQPETVCGQALPTSAPSLISIAGYVSAHPDVVVAGTIVEIWSAGATAPMATQTIGHDGAFSIDVTTAGAPVDGYVRASIHPSYLDGYWYPSSPFASTTELSGAVPLIGHHYGSGAFYYQAPDPTRGWIFVMPSDCNGEPVLGATVSVSAMTNGTVVRYAAGGGDNWSTSPDPTSSGAIIDTPPGPITITITPPNPSLAMRTTRIDVRANMLAVVEIVPQ